MSAPVDAEDSVAAVEPPSLLDWQTLVTGLRRLAEIDRTEVSNPNLPSGFGGALSALDGILGFLRRQRAFMQDPRDLAAITRVYAAMIDVLQGRPSPMFTPVPKPEGGNPGKGVVFEVVKGQAARALSESILAGVPKGEAARKVARACGVLPGHGEVTGQHVISWRDRLQRRPGPGAPKDGAARLAYWGPLPLEMGSTPQQRADSLIEDLKKFAGPVVLNNSH
jgi:hypothetical protein